MSPASRNDTLIEKPPSAEMQRLWFATLKKEWRSLAVMPSRPHGSAADIARALAQVGKMQNDADVKLISALGIDMAAATRLIIDVTGHTAHGGWAIVLLDSVISNPSGIPLAMAADAALLCVELQKADIESGRRTLELIGENKFVGAVAH